MRRSLGIMSGAFALRSRAFVLKSRPQLGQKNRACRTREGSSGTSSRREKKSSRKAGGFGIIALVNSLPKSLIYAPTRGLYLLCRHRAGLGECLCTRSAARRFVARGFAV